MVKIGARLLSLISNNRQVINTKNESAQIAPKMKSYLLNHIQGFQKCKNHQNIPTNNDELTLKNLDISITMNTFVCSLIGAYFQRSIHLLPEGIFW